MPSLSMVMKDTDGKATNGGIKDSKVKGLTIRSLAIVANDGFRATMMIGNLLSINTVLLY